MLNNKQKYSGYTFIELMIVIVVLSVLAGLAIPRWQIAVERFKAKEGEDTLVSVLGSELRYKIDHNGMYTLSGDLVNALDIVDEDKDKLVLKHFDQPQLLTDGEDLYSAALIPGDAPCNDLVANIERRNGEYSLYIRKTGQVLCKSSLVTSDICSKLGFK